MNSTTVFSSLLSIVIIALASIVGVRYKSVKIENDLLKKQVDSLMVQCYKKDTIIDEATSIALSLSDRMGKLYEIDPVTHKKLFSETD
jgi:hypothetical protein